MNREDRLAADGFAGIEPILFYSKRTKGSNFSPHAVRLLDPWTGKSRVYQTGEHRYQAMKSRDQEGHDYVAAASSAFESKKRGHEITLRDGWSGPTTDPTYGSFAWYSMWEVVMAKTIQHYDVREWLLLSDGRPIYEDSPTDDIWGWRCAEDYRGKNLLGRCWMQVRGCARGLTL